MHRTACQVPSCIVDQRFLQEGFWHRHSCLLTESVFVCVYVCVCVCGCVTIIKYTHTKIQCVLPSWKVQVVHRLGYSYQTGGR